MSLATAFRPYRHARPAFALLVGALATIAAPPAEAARRQVEIYNTTAFPIYSLYGWPQQFLPGTVNLMPLALQPSERRTIEINDIYDKCIYNFIANFQNPREKRGLIRKPRKVPDPTWLQSVNICALPKASIDVIAR